MESLSYASENGKARTRKTLKPTRKCMVSLQAGAIW